MTRRCSCDIPFCDGIACYLADPADYPETEETTSVLTLDDLREMYGNPFGTVCEGDPFEKLRRVA